MKKLLFVVLLATLAAATFARADEGVRLDPVRVDLSDTASLQRGARTFATYCLSCHSAAYMRYNRMGHDLGMSDEAVKQNLMFASDRIGNLMTVAMRQDDAQKWFGVAPPDLTVEARARSPEWIYTYLRSFYRDPATPTGWNNVVFPHVAMPDVLWTLQGEQRAVFKPGPDGTRVFDHFGLTHPGEMTPAQYDATIRDLVNFMVYMGEPAKLVRYRIGIFVIIFLAVFWLFAYLLKREYWKDLH